jgi:hypothetical protein
MKTLAIITMAVMLGSNVWAATKSDSQRLGVCIEGGNHAGVADARSRASSLFLSAGVKLEWHSDLNFCQGQGDQAIVVSLLTNIPKTFHPDALAYAYPYEGVHIQVFYDRIALADPELLPYLLAHVIVHEISHILQGIDRHSDSGIMKALWNPYDYTLMKRGQLRFTELDIEIIHDGLAARTARPPMQRSRMVETSKTNGHAPLTVETDREAVLRGAGVRAGRAGCASVPGRSRTSR